MKWEPAPKEKTEAQSSPTAVSQSPAWQNTQKTPIPSQPGGSMPGALTGTLGFSYQTMKTTQGQQFATAKQLSLTWLKPLRSNQSLSLTTNFNQQNATNAKQQSLGSGMIYTNTKFILNFAVNRNENSTMGTAQTPSSNSKSDDLSMGLNVTAMKSLPLNLTFKRATVRSESGGKVTALNVTTAWSAATTLKLFNRITTGLNYASSNAQNKTGNAETKTDSFTLNLSYPISRIFTLNGGLQQTSTESLPQNPDAKSASDSFSTSVGLSANILENLSVGLNFINTSVKNTTVQKTQKTNSSAFVATLGYKPTKDATLNASFNLSGVKGANETATTILTTGFTPQGQNVAVKGVSLSFQQTQVENKDGLLQNKTTDVGLSQNISPIPELPFTIALKRSTAQVFPVTQGASYSETQSKSVNITLPNKIGKKFTQSFGFSRTDSDSITGAAPSVQTVTKSYVYNASRQEVFSLGAKQLPATLAYAATFTNSTASDSATHALTASLQYIISPSLAAVYSLSRSMNQTKNAQTSTSTASTTNNLGLTIKAGKLSGNSALNLINATGSNSQTLSFTLAYALFKKVTWNNSYNYTGTKAAGKNASTFNLISGLLYQF